MFIEELLRQANVKHVSIISMNFMELFYVNINRVIHYEPLRKGIQIWYCLKNKLTEISIKLIGKFLTLA